MPLAAKNLEEAVAVTEFKYKGFWGNSINQPSDNDVYNI